MSEFSSEPIKTLDQKETLEVLAGNGDEFWNRGLDKYRVKSQWLCDLLDQREATEGFQYNAPFQRWFEKEFQVGPFNENSSVLSLLIYTAQRFRRHDKLVREGWRPGCEALLREAFEAKKDLEIYLEPIFNIIVNSEKQSSDPGVSSLKVREIGGKLYAMRPKKRKFAVNIEGKPVRLASR